jgi:phage terminase Nu1 subunit (DNA packaging protein)
MNLTPQDTITSADLQLLTRFSAAHLTQLEKDGVISRAAKDMWLLIETVCNVIQHLRNANRRGRRSEQSDRLAAAKAKAIEIKTAREAAELIPASEVEEEFVSYAGTVTAALVALPARHHPHDLGERRRLEKLVDTVRTELADALDRHAAEIEVKLASLP